MNPGLGGLLGMDDRHDTGLQPVGPSDEELMMRVRAGEQTAFDDLFRRHAGAVCRYARTMCRDVHTAEDLTAEAFVRTLQAVRRGAGPDTAVRAYLLTSVRHVAATWAASAARTQSVDDFSALPVRAVNAGASEALISPGAEAQALEIEEQSLAMRAFRSLPERWQFVLWHVTIHQRAPREVAPMLGLTPNAVSVLVQRAREGLKQAYLQANVAAMLTRGPECRRCVEQLGPYTRGALGKRAERTVRKHLKACSVCGVVAGELESLGQGLPVALPLDIGAFSAAEIEYLNSIFGTAGGTGR